MKLAGRRRRLLPAKVKTRSGACQLQDRVHKIAIALHVPLRQGLLGKS
jgi:hypothetical protein